jgi:hypothetical protein
MRKRILFISLALVLVMTTLIPGIALASSDKYKPAKPVDTSFTGSGMIYVTYMPDPAIKKDTWRYQGEIAEGFLQDSDWDLLAGTAFWSEHDSTVKVRDDGSASGSMKGNFTLTCPDGSGVLAGTFEGRISGNLYTGDISDAGTWKSTEGTGVFEDVMAWGKWSADLSFGPIPGTDIYTLIGPVAWEGKYSSLSKPKIIHKPGKFSIPWKKPVKPWRIIKPGKP